MLKGLERLSDPGVFTGEHGDEDDTFERVVEQLQQMKTRASTLPDDQRREHAERVALKLWAMMGGEEEKEGEAGQSAKPEEKDKSSMAEAATAMNRSDADTGTAVDAGGQATGPDADHSSGSS